MIILTDSKDNIILGDLNIKAFDIDHDANEPFGYRWNAGDKKDSCGYRYGEMYKGYCKITDLDALLVEANRYRMLSRSVPL